MNILTFLSGVKTVMSLRLSKPNIGPLTTAGAISSLCIATLTWLGNRYGFSLSPDVAVAIGGLITAIVQASVKDERHL